jgi:cyclic pyranopterin phosphate synthase
VTDPKGDPARETRELTHLDAEGRARMVDVGEKPVTLRECVARAELCMQPATLQRIVSGGLPKGDALATARIAGIQAAKRTDEWIPLAHPLPIESIALVLVPEPAPDEDGRSRVAIEARVRAHARTGVEMEALVAVAAAGLTLYDMCKAVDRGMTLEAIRLVGKRGGKSGPWERPGEPGLEAPPGG